MQQNNPLHKQRYEGIFNQVLKNVRRDDGRYYANNARQTETRKYCNKAQHRTSLHEFQQQFQVIKDRNDVLLATAQKQLRRWIKHFSETKSYA